MQDDEARFRALFDAHYHRILGYGLRRTDAEDASDLAAEVFATAWRRLDAVPAGDEALLWLYGVARRTLLNQHRSQRRRERLAATLQLQPQPSTEQPDPGPTALAFSRLGDDDRELLALVAWEELDAQAIAALLGCSANAVRIRLHRARRRLASELASTTNWRTEQCSA
jgi:RNA polymerase sigma-70 factor (ECF subfamily)